MLVTLTDHRSPQWGGECQRHKTSQGYLTAFHIFPWWKYIVWDWDCVFSLCLACDLNTNAGFSQMRVFHNRGRSVGFRVQMRVGPVWGGSLGVYAVGKCWYCSVELVSSRVKLTLSYVTKRKVKDHFTHDKVTRSTLTKNSTLSYFGLNIINQSAQSILNKYEFLWINNTCKLLQQTFGLAAERLL